MTFIICCENDHQVATEDEFWVITLDTEGWHLLNYLCDNCLSRQIPKTEMLKTTPTHNQDVDVFSARSLKLDREFVLQEAIRITGYAFTIPRYFAHHNLAKSFYSLVSERLHSPHSLPTQTQQPFGWQTNN